MPCRVCPNASIAESFSAQYELPQSLYFGPTSEMRKSNWLSLSPVFSPVQSVVARKVESPETGMTNEEKADSLRMGCEWKMTDVPSINITFLYF